MTENDLASENGITQTWAERLLNIVLCRGDLANEKLEARPVAVTELFRYGSRLDYIYVIIGSILAALIGVAVPLTCVLTGFICNIYLKENKQIGNDELWKHAMWLCLGFGLVGVLLLVLCYLQYYFLYTASKNVVKNLRKEFVKAVLKQEAIWFDQKHAGTITTQLNENIARIQDGIGDKIGLIARGISIFLSSVIYSLILEWKMTLIMIGVGPASAMTMGLMAKLSANSIKRLIEISGDAGATTEESIMNVKTVATCNGQKQMVEKYSSKLASGLIWAIRYSFINGFCEGIMYLLLYIFYSLGLIYGIPCYYDGIIHDPGIIFITTSCILIGSYFLGLLGPHMMAILKARVAAAVIYQTIDKETKADSQPFNDEQILQCNGRIEFRDVHFKYPTRESPILQGLSWSASPGETVAFVGKSGCGKSTSIGLLTRFYEADQGSMMIDGKEIRSINLQNLRRMIGIVQQEPCLFNGTIRENIILGRNISHEQSEEAAKIANAHDFIMKLENGYDTLLGTGGVTLSGGQKQRIAIARAVATSPRILLLDEATSALDSESEKIVQLALNKASRGRTTVVIAHRLSTLRDVQRIYVIDQGKVAETGTHFELLKKDGLYSNLAKAQEIGIETERKRMISISSDVSRNIDPLKRFDMRSSGVGRRSLTSSVVSEPIPRHYEKDQKDPNKGFRLDNGLLRVYLSSLGFRPAIYICFFCSVLRGLELPFCAFFQGVTFQALDQTPETYSPFMWKAVGFYLILAVYCWIFLATSIGFGGWASESVTTDLRVKVFRNLLHKNASFFDNPNTSNASCVTILTTQATDIQACFDYRFMLMVNNIVSVIVCFILAMVSSWSIAMVMAGLILLFISLTWFISDKVSKTMEEKSKQDTSAEFAVEIFEQARTIQVLAVEEHFVDIYERLQNISKRCDNMIGILQAMQFALTQSYIYFSDMLTYGVGAYMIYYGYLQAVDVIIAATCANFAGWSVIFASATFADFTRANSSAKSLFTFMKKDSPIEALLEGEKPDIIGSVKVENVSFSYPSRPDVKIARSLNLQAHKGEAIALVGVSGCGKSTIIQLLERFYAPTSGSIKIDNSNVSKISLHHLRSNIALVGQEPVLFKGSILENITLGLENICLAEVRKACKLANAANFIEAFPLSYETNVGEKGKNLSGGQKQRIAIARALIRNPKIILLDEATSALDTESEKMVQAALNEASLGRTSITIAHRLSTISGADRIYYVEDGSVVEFGTHEELIEADGKYAKLVRAQMLVNKE